MHRQQNGMNCNTQHQLLYPPLNIETPSEVAEARLYIYIVSAPDRDSSIVQYTPLSISTDAHKGTTLTYILLHEIVAITILSFWSKSQTFS